MGFESVPAGGFAEQLSPLARPRGESPNLVYAGTVRLPGGQRRERAFVKIFPPQNRQVQVFNEVIAHRMAIQMELPSPLTFPCACKRSLLGVQIERVQPAGDNSPLVLGVASIDGRAKSLKQIVENSPTTWQDVMNWQPIARVALFDEILGNDDRHVDNLIRVGQHEYILIDHERIVFALPWFETNVHELRAKRCDANALATTIAGGTDQVMRQRLIYTAHRFTQERMFEVPHDAEGLEKICGAPIGSASRIVSFFNARRVMLPTLMEWHMTKGDLFRASSFR